MRLIVISTIGLLSLGSLAFFLIEKEDKPKVSKSKDKTIEAIQYLDKIDHKELSLEAVKEIFTHQTSAPISLGKLKSIYILRDLSQKTSIKPEALKYINSLANQEVQQIKLGMIYQDMGLVNEARSCWQKSVRVEAKNLIARSFVREYKFKEAYEFLNQLSDIENFKNFETLNLIYSLELVQNLQDQANQTQQEITKLYPENLEWQLKNILMEFKTGNSSQAEDQLTEMIFCQKLDVNALACAHNARMYLFLLRIMRQGAEAYIDDIVMSASKDSRAIFNISGRSQHFKLFINQKTIEKEIQFYKAFKEALKKESKGKLSLNNSGHLVQNYLYSRMLISTHQSALAVGLMKRVEFNRQIDQIEGLHYGFLNSHHYLLNTAQILHISGRYQSSLKILAQIHKEKYSRASLALYQKNMNILQPGKEIFSSALRQELQAKNLTLKQSITAQQLDSKINELSLDNENDQMILKANQLVKSDPKQAVKIWQELHSKGNIAATTDLALYLQSQGQPIPALEVLKSHRQAGATPRAILLCMAWIKAQDNDYKAMKAHLEPLIKENDLEAVFLLATKAYELQNYTDALKYSQKLIIAKGNFHQAIVIKAKSSLAIFKDLPNHENKALLQKVLQQIESLEVKKNQSLLALLSELNYSLQNYATSLEYARLAEHRSFIKKNLAKMLISKPQNTWSDILKNDPGLFTKSEMKYFEIAHLIQAEKFQQALELLPKNTDSKSFYFQTLCYHALSLHDKRDDLIKVQKNQVVIWQSLAQFSISKNDYLGAAECYENALILKPNNVLISNNFLSCLISAEVENLATFANQAKANFERLPTRQTLDTLVHILKASDKQQELQTLLEGRENLSLEQELILAETYKVKQVKKYKQSLTRLLTNRNIQWDDATKQEALRCLKNSTEDL